MWKCHCLTTITIRVRDSDSLVALESTQFHYIAPFTEFITSMYSVLTIDKRGLQAVEFIELFVFIRLLCLRMSYVVCTLYGVLFICDVVCVVKTFIALLWLINGWKISLMLCLRPCTRRQLLEDDSAIESQTPTHEKCQVLTTQQFSRLTDFICSNENTVGSSATDK